MFRLPLSHFQGVYKYMFRKIYKLLLSIHHFIEHENSSLEAESCSSYSPPRGAAAQRGTWPPHS